MAKILPQSFYRRPPLTVARELIGKRLRRGAIRLRITEVEAYLGPQDTASHARFGQTPRTTPLWGPPGRVYMYLCYGLHQMLNIVTGSHDGTAILIRACEPDQAMTESGLALLQKRRGGKTGPVQLTGPGKVGAALDLDLSFTDHALYRRGELELREGTAPTRLRCGPRVGIDYASDQHRRAPWRFADAHSPWVSLPKNLR